MKAVLTWIDGAGALQTFRWDCTLSRRVRLSAQATTNPVEDGTVVGDHVTFLPIAISLTGLVTNSPIVKSEPDYPTVPGAGLTRSSGAWELLEALYNARKRVAVLTPDRTYEGMVITTLEEAKSQRQGAGLWLTLEFQEMKLVYPESVALPPPVVAKSGLATSALDFKHDLAKQTLRNIERAELEDNRMQQVAEAETMEEARRLATKFQAEDDLADEATVWDPEIPLFNPPTNAPAL
jgi:hypothetical protein